MAVEAGLGDQHPCPHQNTTGCWNSPQTALSAETISPTVQYAFAQSISLCIRLSVPSAAVDSAASAEAAAELSRSALTLVSRLSWRSRPSASSSYIETSGGGSSDTNLLTPTTGRVPASMS